MLQLQRMAFMDMLPRGDIIKALAVGTFYIVVSTVAGVMLFRKAEIQ
jgi:hypothetical protein